MSAFLREFLFLVVKYKFYPVVRHIGTKENFIADYLSRNFLTDAAARFFTSISMEDMKPLEVPVIMFSFASDW